VAVATAAIIVLRILSAALTTPAIRVARGEEGRRSYSLPSASADRDAAHLYDRRLFSVEDANSPWTFSDLVEPSPNRVDLWRSRCHPQAHPSRNPFRPMCCPITGLLLTLLHAAYRGRRGVDLLVRGPGSVATVSRDDGPKPENTFCRIRDSRAFTHERRIAKIFWTLSTCPHRFAFYPSAPVRQAVLRISFWLAPSLTTTRPCDRPVKKTRDALNRLLPLKRKRAPAPRAFPTRSTAFTAWTSHGD